MKLPKDKRVQNAFAAPLSKGASPPPWDCSRGMHEPVFMIHRWACARCHGLL